MRKIVSIITLIFVSQLYSQNIIINKEIKKLKNEKEYKLLINSLNNFLKTDIKSNKWISQSDFLET